MKDFFERIDDINRKLEWLAEKNEIFKKDWQSHIQALLLNGNSALKVFQDQSKEMNDVILFILLIFNLEIPCIYKDRSEDFLILKKARLINAEWENMKKDTTYLFDRILFMMQLQESIKEDELLSEFFTDNPIKVEDAKDIQSEVKLLQKFLHIQEDCRLKAKNMYTPIGRRFGDILKEINKYLSDRHDTKFISRASEEIHPLASRKMEDNSGIPILCLRYIVFCLYIAELYQPNRKTYTLIHNLLSIILPPEYNPIEIDDIPKYLKGISFDEAKRKISVVFQYTFTVDQLFDIMDTPAIEKKRKEWQDNALSYNKYHQIVLSNINLENSL